MCSNMSPEDEYTTKVERIIGENTDLTRDLENWMTKLPQSLRSVPIIYLALPGLIKILLYTKPLPLENFRIS